MPIPSPTKTETHDEYITRCMEDAVMTTEYPDKDQRLAICESQWSKRDSKAMSALMENEWAILPDTLMSMIEIVTNHHNILALAAQNGIKTELNYEIRDDIAIIPIVGPIMRYGNLFAEVCGSTSVSILSRRFNEALNDPKVNGILLNIDSPGGQVSGISEMADMIYNARDKKPVHVYIDDLCCSAAYWLGSAASNITASDTSKIGSIGIVASYNNTKGPGIEIVNSRSPKKRIDVTSEDGKASIIAYLDQLADIFYKKVARNRNVSESTVIDNYGQGGVVLSQEAVSIGMIDAVGTFEQAFENLRRLTMKIENLDQLRAEFPDLVKAAEAGAVTELKAQVDALTVEKADAVKRADEIAKNLLENEIKAISPAHSDYVMSFHGKLSSEEMKAMATKFAEQETKMKTITDELGKPAGDSAPSAADADSEEADERKAAELAKEKGITLVEARIEIERNKI